MSISSTLRRKASSKYKTNAERTI